ncbi:type II toxin-antitoxin system RelE/ParE family toxin [Marinomonas sp. RSW2]|uniref:Type II toxin-antitoxin system RelE/ParE family toxin n=1 Tax=Marinomonas maritima TaxID=2940935 RepID=A0ABT5WIY6_9GAMM|nr:type II toxin-antitoxin system RelE/ParE family toxin [Marinomonas maritima]MDE8604778.1 type II toxin-antitoxin system RelE/ParE family toxin [Marinomonas maritima]
MDAALENVNELAEYIALSNPQAARALVKNIFATVDRLDVFPLSGRIPEELNEFNYREVIVNPCRVFYKIQNDDVYILYVLRQERDVRRYIIELSKN